MISTLLHPFSDQDKKHQTTKCIDKSSPGLGQYFKCRSKKQYKYAQRQGHVEIQLLLLQAMPSGLEILGSTVYQYRNTKGQIHVPKECQIGRASCREREKNNDVAETPTKK